MTNGCTSELLSVPLSQEFFSVTVCISSQCHVFYRKLYNFFFPWQFLPNQDLLPEEIETNKVSLFFFHIGSIRCTSEAINIPGTGQPPVNEVHQTRRETIQLLFLFLLFASAHPPLKRRLSAKCQYKSHRSCSIMKHLV